MGETTLDDILDDRVNIFFFLPGLMLSRSFALKPHLASFIAARMRKIFPGLDASFGDLATVFYPFKILRSGF